MRYFSIFLLLIFTSKLHAQVTITPGAYTSPPKTDPYVYDSSFNFNRSRRELLIGQQVYFIPYSKKYTGNKSEFSDRFLSNPSQLLNNPNVYYYQPLPEYCVYRPVRVNANPPVFQTPLNQVLGRYFIVGDFEQNNNTSILDNRINLMGLSAVENKDDVFYFRLDKANEFNNTGIDNFLVVGYYEKLKQKHINQYYYLVGNYTMPVKDITTGELIALNDNNERWQCVDVTLLETSIYPKLILSLLLKNSKGATIPATIDMPTYTTIKSYTFFEVLPFKTFISEQEYVQQKRLNKQ